MKAEKKERFMPVILTLETQEEVDKIFALMNHKDLADAVELGDDNPLAGFETDNYEIYHERLRAIPKM
jgi:uncharacterized protein YpbB